MTICSLHTQQQNLSTSVSRQRPCPCTLPDANTSDTSLTWPNGASTLSSLSFLMSSEQHTIPVVTRRLMFHTLAKTSSKYLEMDADITRTLNRFPLCYSLNHKILNFRVVNVTFSGGKYPGGQKKEYVCLYLSLLYLVRVVNTPAPLGSPIPTSRQHSQPKPAKLCLGCILLADNAVATEMRYHIVVCLPKLAHLTIHCAYRLAIVAPTLQVRLGG